MNTSAQGGEYRGELTISWKPSIFKSYDIRGLFGSEVNEDAAYAVGNALVRFLEAKSIAVGFDTRESSPLLFAALTRGIMDAGANVQNLGLCATPYLYFATSHANVDGGVMITASHNPKAYNGFKLCRKNAVALGAGSGLEHVKAFTEQPPGIAEIKGTLTECALQKEYIDAVTNDVALTDAHFSLAIDCANAMGIFELPVYEQFPSLTVSPLFTEYDSSFPNHEPNPLEPENMHALQTKVLEVGANIGIAYDGDADRVGFVDERGAIVPADMVVALIAREIVKKKPGAAIIFDVRTSRVVREIVEELGGVALESRVGHAHIKRLMREFDAEFAGELAQHFYFKDMSFAESSTRAALILLSIMEKARKPLSALVHEVMRYHHSGEINLSINNPQAALAALMTAHTDGVHSELDGLKVSYPEWWFSLRVSNTEPLVRLNIEADTKTLLQEKKAELIALIEKAGG